MRASILNHPQKPQKSTSVQPRRAQSFSPSPSLSDCSTHLMHQRLLQWIRKRRPISHHKQRISERAELWIFETHANDGGLGINQTNYPSFQHDRKCWEGKKGHLLLLTREIQNLFLSLSPLALERGLCSETFRASAPLVLLR